MKSATRERLVTVRKTPIGGMAYDCADLYALARRESLSSGMCVYRLFDDECCIHVRCQIC